MKVNTGGPAFPGLNPEFTGISSDGQERYEIQPSGGMTLRDYFAAKAMQSLILQCTGEDNEIPDAAEDAYRFSDAMLKARKA